MLQIAPLDPPVPVAGVPDGHGGVGHVAVLELWLGFERRLQDSQSTFDLAASGHSDHAATGA
jgi:hypothetical protein